MPISVASAAGQAQLPAVVDASSASDDAAAHAIATTFGHAVLVVGDMSETESVVANADGSFTMSESSQPVRVQQGGAWVPADSTLDVGGAALVPAAAAVPVQFSAGGSGPLAKVQTPDGNWVSESWSDGAVSAPSVDGSSATYPEVFPGVDLRLSATSTGMAEVLVIKNAAAATNPALAQVRFGIDNGDLTTTASTGGTAITQAADGSTQLTSAAPTWWDSSAPGASADGPGGRGAAMPVPTTTTDTQITIDAQVAMAAPSVTYPVYVDPPFTGTVRSWAYVDAAYPNQAYWKSPQGSDGYQHVGYIDGPNSAPDYLAHTARSYWQLDTARVEGTRIENALFNTTEEYSFSCTPSAVSLYTVGAFNSSTTWNTRPALSALTDTETVAYGYNSSCPAHAVGFQATDAVQRAADAGSDSIWLALVASESSNSGWKKFDSAAYLIITYDSYPFVPYNRKVSCFAVCGLGAVTGSRTPLVTAQSRISDPVPLDYTFQVCAGTVQSQGGCNAAVHLPNQTSGHDVSVNLPTLAEGAWVWRVFACNNQHPTLCSDWSGWFNFTVDLHGPANPPSATSAGLNFNSGVNGSDPIGSPATFSIGANGSTGIWGYEYSTAGSFVPLSKAVCPQKLTDTTKVICGQGSPAGTIIPQKASGDVYIYAIDSAGNPSPVFDGVFQLDATLAVQVSHAWVGQPTDLANNTSTIQDQASNPSLAMHLSSTSWVSDPATPTTHAGVGLSFNGTSSEGVSDASAAAPPLTLDSAHSATLAAWVKPGTATSGNRVIMSQDASGGYSTFTLQQTAAGYFQFCMATSTTAGTQDCATTVSDFSPQTASCNPTGGSPYTPSSDEIWLLVVGEWNAGTSQVTVGTYAYDNTGQESLEQTPSHVSCPVHHTAIAASAGAVVLGRDLVGGTKGHRWNGLIADPLLYPRWQDTDGVTSLYDNLPDFGSAS